jgi:hypothetical protein
MQVIIYGANMAERGTIKIGQTDGYRYFGFQPPLTKEEFESIPLPTTESFHDDIPPLEWRPTSVEYFPDESMDVGFNTYAFGSYAEGLVSYAKRIEKHLGNRALDSEIYWIGPGSVTAQAAGAPAEW